LYFQTVHYLHLLSTTSEATAQIDRSSRTPTLQQMQSRENMTTCKTTAHVSTNH